MCRVITYLGSDISIENLFYLPDNSLIKQSYHPVFMKGKLNLAGFGFTAWNEENAQQIPYYYRTCELPFYDKNLKNLATKIVANCILAHVRGVSYSAKQVISVQNAHPFLYQGTHLAFAHNGDLAGHQIIKDDLLKYIKPEFKTQIEGTTDSELIYALFLSQIKGPENEQTIEELFTALLSTIAILTKLRKKYQLKMSSPLNLFISNGQLIVATRFILDYGQFGTYKENEFFDPQYNSLWYTYGEKYNFFENQFQMTAGEKNQSIIIASEPLTKDQTTWIEVPPYSFIAAKIENKILKIQSLDIIL